MGRRLSQQALTADALMIDLDHQRGFDPDRQTPVAPFHRFDVGRWLIDHVLHPAVFVAGPRVAQAKAETSAAAEAWPGSTGQEMRRGWRGQSGS